MQYSTRYIFLFSAALCLACSTVISLVAVALRPAIARNEIFDQRKSVLYAAWLAEPGEALTLERVETLFKNIEARVIDLETGDYVEDVDAETFDPASAPRKPAHPNNAGIKNVPEQVKIFQVMKDGKVEMLILPVYGMGLWGTLYGYLALRADGDTIAGLTYYSHQETPGLGAEVDNPRWKGKWPEREIYDEEGNVAIEVIKGQAESPQKDPHRVDGLSGATITSRGVTNMLHYWFADTGYKPFLEKFLNQASA